LFAFGCLAWVVVCSRLLLPQISNDVGQQVLNEGNGGGVGRRYSLKYDKMLFETFSVIDTPVSRQKKSK